MDRFWSKVEKTDGCWNWIGAIHPKGYGLLTMDKKSHRVHRLSYQLSNGSIPLGMHVLHECDNRRCVNPGHLFIGTNADNMADKVSKGRQSRKLSDEDVLAIRSAKGIPQHALAKQYGVDQSHISRIRSGHRNGRILREKNQ
ncbi:HNH endonuclease [Bradyrhizobium sp. LVM 105]|uniref:HNH endonuclease n=1 Tax=Bradyrhizobium sp. LVM 105 TaxID=2341115 RepID=UPI000F803C06|nr:HNH endonuclease [Bradyrhizobium sp. LVM 105]RTE91923.1 hypothetical protein D6B98_16040 [Bradyrhizobium sp. LVM 105]